MEKLYKAERLKLFTDAVIAIVMTLLILELKIPDLARTASNHQLLKELQESQDSFIAYLIAFWLISRYWSAHFRAFDKIEHINNKIITLNIFFILSLTFIPFPASLMGHFTNSASAILFILSISLPAGILALLLNKIHCSPDLYKHVNEHHYHHQYIFRVMLTICAVGTITAIATTATNWGMALWCLCFFISDKSLSLLPALKRHTP
jgi:uncharacterized membrane protein